MKRVLVDTDVLIDFTKGSDRTLASLLSRQAAGELELAVTPVNIAEFMNDSSIKTPDRERRAKEFLGLFSVRDLTSEIGLTAGKYLRRGSVAFLGDAMIAAACTVGNLSLLTRNRKHFSHVSGLTFYA